MCTTEVIYALISEHSADYGDRSQKALNDIPTWYAVGLYWVPGHAGKRGNEIADELVRGGSGLGFFGPEPALWVSRQDTQNKLNHWLANQHWARW